MFLSASDGAFENPHILSGCKYNLSIANHIHAQHYEAGILEAMTKTSF